MIKFQFQENVTEYLDKIDKLSSNEVNTKRFLRDAAQELHTQFVAPLMPKWNPNLIFSPMEREHQIVETSPTFSSIELIYTGFTEQEEEGLDKVFSEFAEHGDPTTGHLERDYARFQETGEDPIADYGGGYYFVKGGTNMYEGAFQQKTKTYLDAIMHLEKWEAVSYIDLYDFMDVYI